METLDRYDVKLLAELQRDGAQSVEALAERIGLSKTPCWRRIGRLRELGVIERTVTLLDPAAVGLGTTLFVHIKVEKHDADLFRRIDQALCLMPEVLEAHLMLGEADYLVRVAVPDVAAFERFMTDKLHRLPGIKETRSSLSARLVKRTTELPLAQLNGGGTDGSRRRPRRTGRARG
ncbi:MAG TPA: Lrp/AsnC family transcriptional regulator [Gammaproteobacteria bacterium]|mgnify:CR=1 FL=1|nr:Lrp/AsnC family transcriptional regulator [Gammaproteobacteria bacterium]